jgi:anti-sigma regulatory factor (Ser/Thr protein kinase)
LSFQIVSQQDRLWAAGQARRFAAVLGFCELDQARLAVCIAELASNLAGHAGGTVCRLLGEVRMAARAGGGLLIEGVFWKTPRALV